MPTTASTIALITGGGTGIGRGMARAWARRGGTVVLVGRRAGPLGETAGEIVADGGQAWAWQADITQAAERVRLAAAVRAQCGGVDVLVHGAGVLAGGPFARHSARTIEEAMQVNLLAPMLLTQEWLPVLRARRGGVIVVGSHLSGVPLPGASLYGASKAGLCAWALALALEEARAGVHVLLAHPPGTRTALTAGMARAVGGRVPLADPLQVGERIVRAWEQGQHEVAWGAMDSLPALLHRLSPRLLGWLARWQAARLEQLFSREAEHDE